MAYRNVSWLVYWDHEYLQSHFDIAANREKRGLSSRRASRTERMSSRNLNAMLVAAAISAADGSASNELRGAGQPFDGEAGANDEEGANNGQSARATLRPRRMRPTAVGDTLDGSTPSVLRSGTISGGRWSRTLGHVHRTVGGGDSG
jgi:hypothetical protein